MSKDEVRRLGRQVEKLEATQNRHLDMINRLIGYEMDGTGDIPPYEHELMTLNEKLAIQDLRLEALEGALRRIRQSCTDVQRVAPLSAQDHLRRMLEIIEEVMPDARPAHVATGHDTTDVPVTDRYAEISVVPDRSV